MNKLVSLSPFLSQINKIFKRYKKYRFILYCILYFNKIYLKSSNKADYTQPTASPQPPPRGTVSSWAEKGQEGGDAPSRPPGGWGLSPSESSEPPEKWGSYRRFQWAAGQTKAEPEVSPPDPAPPSTLSLWPCHPHHSSDYCTQIPPSPSPSHGILSASTSERDRQT